MRFLAAILLILGLAVPLAACGSAKPSDTFASVLENEPVAGEPADSATTEIDASALQEEMPVGAEVPNAIATVRLSPVVGAPPQAVQAMSRQIRSSSNQHRIAIVAPDSAGATHDMKGYFSAITEGGRTTVIYVWDVFDASGNRLHRIQGQETAPGTSPDGWSSVSAATMEVIGARTMDAFSQWLARHG